MSLHIVISPEHQKDWTCSLRNSVFQRLRSRRRSGSMYVHDFCKTLENNFPITARDSLRNGLQSALIWLNLPEMPGFDTLSTAVSHYCLWRGMPLCTHSWPAWRVRCVQMPENTEKHENQPKTWQNCQNCRKWPPNGTVIGYIWPYFTVILGIFGYIECHLEAILACSGKIS